MALHLSLASAIVNENRSSVATVSLEFLKSKFNWTAILLYNTWV